MILTITPNAALDRVLFIDEFRPGTTMRPDQMIDCVGGKGLDASVALRALGVDTLALSFVGGDTGRRLVSLLDGYGIRHDLIWLTGETRLAHVVIERRYYRHSHLIAGKLPVTAEAAADMLRRYRDHVQQAAWVVAGGSLPPGIAAEHYRHLTEIARQANVPILLDGAGPPILAALPARPTILKMNWGEFNRTFDLSASTIEALISQAGAVFERGELPSLVLTCGEQGILAFTPEGSYWATSPVQKAVNAAGAGDAASAALAWRLASDDLWPEALRWAAAVSAAVVLTECTADCHMTDIRRILAHTQIQQI